MSTWRCPHCGTPQTESGRCWVCRRSSTSCGTCRHFRRSVAGQLAYCGLDTRRAPLSGYEIRGCWEEAALQAAVVTAPPSGGSASGLDFVPVDGGPVDGGPLIAPSEPTPPGGGYVLFDLET